MQLFMSEFLGIGRGGLDEKEKEGREEKRRTR